MRVRHILTAFLMLVAIPAAAMAQSLVRKDVLDLTPAEISSLRRGVAVMMQRNDAPRDSVDYRRSWVYWANVHGHFGSCHFGSVDPDDTTFSNIEDFIGSPGVEQETWCKCTHGNPEFLTWHRMYLYFFEQVLREAAGDNTLTLPYWNYHRDRRLPPIFREENYRDGSGQNVRNPLYLANREANLGQGQPLTPRTVDLRSTFRETRFELFSDQLEGSVHNGVHCAIGMQSCGSGYMGHPASAALDPIFYFHHANIDRLYECWLGPAPGSRLPSDPAVIHQTYRFIDRNGAPINRRVDAMLRTAQLTYSYSRPENCPRAAALQGSSFLEAPGAQRFQIGGPGQLSRGGPTQTPLQVGTEAQTALRTSQFLSAEPRRTMLVIRGLTFDAAPRTSYEVYLVTPAGERVFTGTVSFFGALAAAGHGGDDSRESDEVFEVTHRLHVISPQGELPEGTRLEFVPTTGVSGTTATQAAANIPANANVRYGSVELVILPE